MDTERASAQSESIKSELTLKQRLFAHHYTDPEGPAEAHVWRQRSQRVKAAAGELEAFRRSLTSFQRAIRNTFWDSCNDLERWADSQPGFSEDPRWEEFARVPSRRRLADAVDRYITEVGQMGARELIALRSRIVGGASCQ